MESQKISLYDLKKQSISALEKENFVGQILSFFSKNASAIRKVISNSPEDEKLFKKWHDSVILLSQFNFPLERGDKEIFLDLDFIREIRGKIEKIIALSQDQKEKIDQALNDIPRLLEK